MKKLLLIAAAAMLLAAPAFGQSLGERTGVNSMMGIAPKDADFVKEAAISDMFEIKAGQLAQDRGDQQAKDFAGKMIHDHSETTAELKNLVESGKVQAQLPAGLDKSHQAKLDKLQKLNGADFNKQYDKDQVAAHKAAVSLFKRYAKNGKNADLKAFTRKYLPHIEQHLQMAEDLNPRTTTGQTAK
ncbi:MAG: DUF4142 domain-containing protein [Pseudolabrys sp.]